MMVPRIVNIRCLATSLALKQRWKSPNQRKGIKGGQCINWKRKSDREGFVYQTYSGVASKVPLIPPSRTGY
jgi:hypothetical protein